MDNEQTKPNFGLEKILGLILLTPPLLSVLLFIINVFSSDMGRIVRLANLGDNWTGGYNFAQDSGGGGYTSAAPIYLGLMAIAGALLLKGSDKK